MYASLGLASLPAPPDVYTLRLASLRSPHHLMYVRFAWQPSPNHVIPVRWERVCVGGAVHGVEVVGPAPR